MACFSEYLKNILLVVVLIQLLPIAFGTFKKYYESMFEVRSKVGVVCIDGLIGNTEHYAKQLRKFFKDPDIKAIVLKIESPGGASGSAQALFQEIKDLKKEYAKTIVSYTENLCGSAAYYIACAADHIIAQPSTLVGSVGVYIGYPNLKEFIEYHKIKYTTITSGAYKTAGLMFKDLSIQQRGMLQSITDDSYKQFVKDVASRRPRLTSLDQKIWADGKIFSGQQGRDLGLVDELGSQSTLIRFLKAKAPIEGEIVWVHPPKPGVLASLFGREEELDDTDSTFDSCSKALSNRLLGFFETPHSV